MELRATRLIPAARRSKPSRCPEVVMRFAGVTAIALCICARPQPANAQIEQMEGKSIIVSYREAIHTNSGKIFVNNLSEKIYISDKQNIFLRLNNTSKFGSGGSETRSDSFDTVGDRQGVGEGSRTKFAWNGNGLVRSWTNKETGVQLTETIGLTGSSCHFQRDRNSFNGHVVVELASCRIVKGNALR
jgi:hypothetical protein